MSFALYSNLVGTLQSLLLYNAPDLNRNITEIFGKLINIYRGKTSMDIFVCPFCLVTFFASGSSMMILFWFQKLWGMTVDHSAITKLYQ